MNIIENIKPILLKLSENNFLPLLVGGCVRDLILNIKPNDIDIEVFGCNITQLTDILKEFGEVNEVGKSYGILKFKYNNFYYDFSIPRTENKTGNKHTEFSITVNPNLTIKDASLRRDFTFNSLYYNLITEEIIDLNNGKEHLNNNLLVHNSNQFSEDPLRVLRGFQFAGRFNLDVDNDTAELCANLKDEYKYLSVERIWMEWYKWATQSIAPSKGLYFLLKTKWIKLYPEIFNLVGVNQSPDHHPEGDAFIHTCYVVDEAINIANRENLNIENKLILVLAALCHDFGKPSTTKLREVRGELKWTSYGHESAGVSFAEQFLNSIGCPKNIILNILPLVKEHLAHINFKEHSVKNIRKLSEKMKPSNIYMLGLLCEADVSGRPPLSKGKNNTIINMLKMAKQENCLFNPMENFLGGKDLLTLGIKPGPLMGDILNNVRNLQLNAKLNNKKECLLHVHENYKKHLITN